MSRLGLWNRVRSWFGGKVDSAGASPSGGRRCTLGPAEAGARLGLVGGASSMATTTDDRVPEADATRTPDATTRRLPPLPLAAGPAPTPARLDPMDPDWMQSLDTLPERLAESSARTAAGTRALEEIAYELEGHRETGRALVESLRRMPTLAGNQLQLHEETNKILLRQSNLLESMFDGITAMRSAFRSVEESSKRSVLALGQLESCHRQILYEYQAMLLKAHRRLGLIALLAVTLAAAALAGVAYVAVAPF